MEVDEERVDVNNLNPGAKYVFKVSAQNEVGISKPSASVHAFTDGAPPTEAPKDVKVYSSCSYLNFVFSYEYFWSQSRIYFMELGIFRCLLKNTARQWITCFCKYF